MFRVTRAWDWALGSFDWMRVGQWWITLIGIIGVAVTIASLLVHSPQDSKEPVLWLLGSALGLSLAIALVPNYTPYVQTWLVPCHRRLLFVVRRGDLLDESLASMPTVLTMSRRFSLAAPDVNDQSLIHQLAQRYGGPNRLAIDHPDVRFDVENDQEAGKIAILRDDGRAYILLATTTLPKPNHDATRLPLGDVWVALGEVWRWRSDHNCSVRLPVIGSGHSGSAVGHELLMSLIAISAVVNSQERPPTSDKDRIELVVWHEDWNPRRIAQLSSLLKDLGCNRLRGQ